MCLGTNYLKMATKIEISAERIKNSSQAGQYDTATWLISTEVQSNVVFLLESHKKEVVTLLTEEFKEFDPVS